MDQYIFLKYQLISCFPVSCTCMPTLKHVILPPLKLALKLSQMCHNFPLTPQFHLQNPLKPQICPQNDPSKTHNSPFFTHKQFSYLPSKSPPQKPTIHPFSPQITTQICPQNYPFRTPNSSPFCPHTTPKFAFI